MESNASPASRAGPLADLRVVEFAGIGPGPFACMLLRSEEPKSELQ